MQTSVSSDWCAYTSIIFDRTIALKDACGIDFHHKPVLPMIMRGVAITRAKGKYIMFDTKREADYAGVPFGPMVTPIGEPTQRLGNPEWKPMVERHQQEMIEGLGLWGVPSYRLSGGEGEPDLAVWGQDRLWLVAAEIRRRAGL